MLICVLIPISASVLMLVEKQISRAGEYLSSRMRMLAFLSSRKYDRVAGSPKVGAPRCIAVPWEALVQSSTSVLPLYTTTAAGDESHL